MRLNQAVHQVTETPTKEYKVVTAKEIHEAWIVTTAGLKVKDFMKQRQALHGIFPDMTWKQCVKAWDAALKSLEEIAGPELAMPADYS